MRIPNAFFQKTNSLYRQNNFHHLLEIGCGKITTYTTLLSKSNQGYFLGYDPDQEKINFNLNGYQPLSKHEGTVSFTPTLPHQQFDMTLSNCALHEDPQDVLNTHLELVKLGGIIAIQDYNLKDLSPEEFLLSWGWNKKEQEVLQDKNCYQTHTRLGLEDLIAALAKRKEKIIILHQEIISRFYLCFARKLSLN